MTRFWQGSEREEKRTVGARSRTGESCMKIKLKYFYLLFLLIVPTIVISTIMFMPPVQPACWILLLALIHLRDVLGGNMVRDERLQLTHAEGGLYEKSA
jgi:hypothetical protein